MTPKIISIRPLAESDLESIYTYSFREFGIDRAIVTIIRNRHLEMNLQFYCKYGIPVVY